jgi:hypothetical protein
MRLIALKISDAQYTDLVTTAHQRRERSLSSHIRRILIEQKAMRRAPIHTSTRLPSVAQLELLKTEPAKPDYVLFSNGKGPASKTRRPRRPGRAGSV